MRQTSNILRKAATGALAIGFVLSTFASGALAGENITTFHELKIKVKGSIEEDKGTEGTKAASGSINEKDIIEACLGEESAKGFAVVLSMECGNMNNNSIDIISLDPLQNLMSIGYVGFFNEAVISTSKDGTELKKLTDFAFTLLVCGDVTLLAEIYGAIDVSFKENCQNTAQQSGSGVAEILGEDAVITGASISAKKRSASISGVGIDD